MPSSSYIQDRTHADHLECSPVVWFTRMRWLDWVLDAHIMTGARRDLRAHVGAPLRYGLNQSPIPILYF
ncbi:MAG: hypothetical protein RID53_15380 [Coleofasciculus sp. B1-GNL1-01]|uniref:hypothetical protein n=1 Tax=Coleofasciculus sp. B1-GNL1-01 TaxID=3068484 RepID=UPI00330167C1